MERKYVDCREFPESKCTVSMAADSERELLDIAMEHAVKAHGFADTPETREKIKGAFRNGCCC